MKCKDCGRQIPEGALFCKYCGARADAGETAGDGKKLNFEKGQKGVRRAAAKKGSRLVVALVVLLILAIGVLAAVLIWKNNTAEPVPEDTQTPAAETLEQEEPEAAADEWTASLLPQDSEIEIGENLMLNATIDQPLDTISVRSTTWQSSKPTVATVSDGIVYGIGAGETEITAQLALSDGSSVECRTKITVVESRVTYTVALTPGAATMHAGDAVTLTAQLEQELPEEVEVVSTVWSSNNNNVASVSNGNVSAVSIGSATISVTINLSNGQAASANAAITVVADQPVTSNVPSGGTTSGGTTSGSSGGTTSGSSGGTTSGSSGGTTSGSSGGTTSGGSGGTTSGGGNYSTYNDYVLPNSDTALYSYETLRGLNAWTLRVARNEIYARHGRMFKDADLQAHFNSKSWYKGTIAPENFDASVLNKVEVTNIDRIKEIEASR